MADTVSELFEDLARQINSVPLPVHDIAAVIQSSIASNFRAGGRYADGEEITLLSGGSNTWKPLAESTKKRYKAKGLRTDRTLSRSAGGLASAIEVRGEGNRIIISALKPYAAIQNFGGAAGRNGSSIIPAAPYLVLQKHDLDDIRDIIIDQFK